ncbi:unnamed protein product, partial [Rotaria magnacalcarata]
MSRISHPDYAEPPIEMNGIVTIHNLVVGESYVLLRYSSYKYVPSNGTINNFLSSKFEEKFEFVANDKT